MYFGQVQRLTDRLNSYRRLARTTKVAMGQRIGSRSLPPPLHGHYDHNPEKIIGNSVALFGSKNQYDYGWNN